MFFSVMEEVVRFQWRFQNLVKYRRSDDFLQKVPSYVECAYDFLINCEIFIVIVS